ncbi:MAG: baseplate hub protein [Candidatus Phlomobacter fragariae]
MKSQTPFFRDYEILVSEGDNAVKIVPPFKMAFSFSKDLTNDRPNIGQISLFNLSPSRRQSLAAFQYRKQHISGQLAVGYLTTGLKLIFSGSVTKVTLSKQGTETITTLEIADGGFSYRTATISKAVKSKDEAFDEAVKTMDGVKKGKLTPQQPLGRPKIMTGYSFDELRKLKNEEEQIYIDNGQLHILKRNEVQNGKTELISASTGLMETPTRDDKNVLTFKSVLNPNVSIGYQVAIESAVAVHLNGVYRIFAIDYAGEIDTGEWLMTCKCRQEKNYAVVKENKA